MPHARAAQVGPGGELREAQGAAGRMLGVRVQSLSEFEGACDETGNLGSGDRVVAAVA